MHVDDGNGAVMNPPQLQLLGPPRRRSLNVEVPDLRCVSGEVDAQSGRWFTSSEPPTLMRKSSLARTPYRGGAASVDQDRDTLATTRSTGTRTTTLQGPDPGNNNTVKLLNVKPRSAFRPNALLDRSSSRSRSGDNKSVIITSTRPVISKFHSEYSHYYLGKGAFGDVFKATSLLRAATTSSTANANANANDAEKNSTNNNNTNQNVLPSFAIKRVHIQKRSADQTLTEVRTMQYLQNTTPLPSAYSSSSTSTSTTSSSSCIYLVQFLESWKEDDYLYIRMELCARDSCRQMVLHLRDNEWSEACLRYPSLQRNVVNVLHDATSEIEMDCDDGSRDLLLRNRNRNIARILPEQVVWQIGHDIASALQHMHSLKIVHHDVKPSNILFALRGNDSVVCKLGDFGLAGEIGTEVDDGQEGDFSYMPKELLAATSRNMKQATTDIFSLGITLYEVAASAEWVLPDGGERWHDIRQENHILEVPRSHRSADLMAVIQRMISPHVTHRPSASDLVQEVQRMKRQWHQQHTKRDLLLLEYVHDVQRFDQQCEREIAAAYEEAVQRCITPTDAMLTSGLHSFNVTPLLSTPSKDTDSPASPPHFQPT